MNEQIYEKIMKAKVRMMLKFPFFAVLCSKLKLIEDDTLPTAATDGIYIYYNPEYIEKMDIQRVIFILVHETMHNALKHLWRGRNYDKKLFNIAADIAIHNIMDEFFTIPEEYMYEPKFKGLSSEEIYQILKKNQKEMEKFLQKNMPGDHSKWRNQDEKESNNTEESSKLAKSWEKAVISTAKYIENSMANNKNKGTIPGFFKRMIQRISSPVKDWRILLREYIEPEITDYTFVKPDYRLDYDAYGCFLPSFADPSEKIEKVYFWIDTSGSINNDELDAIYSEVIGAINQFNSFEGYLGFFDSEAYEPKPFNSVNSLKEIIPKGGGGTDFNKPFEYMEKNNCESKCNIILTDGYCEFPNPDKINSSTIWLITTENIKAPEKCGRTVYLELKNKVRD